MKSCNKIREAYGLKILVNEETYNEYKGTLEEQIDELQKRIYKAIEEINKRSSKEVAKLYIDILEGNYDKE